ncbi:AAA family ATPase [Porcipelethomonas ammoniilytica]|uniref:AAA family ATPase n=1 Tax=Porcipelethomonas ammoniilytica TaxID=2981722 RepID=UPI0008234ECF|nr:AAA family ATPase [Porcipelethomonas ammoniilytica]MCU6719482.1 AAA family ATPase [Porcipelethomonas ammoniilytica]SCI81832.1 5-methylcytosine-specific restriction enzyme B [uncultured Ruminococcus sp.]
MERDERYEVNSQGSIVVGTPVTLTPSERKSMIENMFSINGWTYTLLEEITSAHYYIELKNENLQIEKRFHLFHGNVRKEDPERNREEKKIQLGTENDPRQYFDDALILGFYVYESKNSLADTIIVAWPIEEGKNYPANPSLRVNMRTDVMPAKNAGYYVDRTTGKNLVVFRPEFIYHYIENYKDLHYGPTDVSHPGDMNDDGKIDNTLEPVRLAGGTNVLLYGVPGSGKSWTIEHEYCKPGTVVERLVFHPDYTNADFIGQILPVVDPVDKMVTYEFTPGPFTNILKEAYNNPSKSYVLIIEEINRGNAPAIFGDVFQLLDRTVETKVMDGISYPRGTSEYGITNENIAKVVYENGKHKVRIPSNLSILGTMNTSDQNVFTLDTAFQRRWNMRLIENNFNNVRGSLANAEILDTKVTWQKFCETVNTIIIGNRAKMASAEDKRLGVYFVHEQDLAFDSRVLPTGNFMTTYDELNDLVRHELLGTLDATKKARLEEMRDAILHNRLFPEKVIKYLWDDAFKFNPEAIFDTENMDSLEEVIRTFVYSKGSDRFKIFKQNVRDTLYPTQQ